MTLADDVHKVREAAWLVMAGAGQSKEYRNLLQHYARAVADGHWLVAESLMLQIHSTRLVAIEQELAGLADGFRDEVRHWIISADRWAVCCPSSVWVHPTLTHT